MEDLKLKWLSSDGKTSTSDSSSNKPPSHTPKYEGNFIGNYKSFHLLGGVGRSTDKKDEATSPAKQTSSFENKPPLLNLKPYKSQDKETSFGYGEKWAIGREPKQNMKPFTTQGKVTSFGSGEKWAIEREPKQNMKPFTTQGKVTSFGSGEKWAIGKEPKQDKKPYTSQNKVTSFGSLDRWAIGREPKQDLKDKRSQSVNVGKASKEQETSYTKSNAMERKIQFDKKVDGSTTSRAGKTILEASTSKQSSSTTTSIHTSIKTSEIYSSSGKTQLPIKKEVGHNEKANRVLGTTQEMMKEWDMRVRRTDPVTSDTKRVSHPLRFNNAKQTMAKLTRSLSFNTKTKTPTSDVTLTGVPKDAEEYPMGHPRRGLAIVFNHNVFDQLAPRKSIPRECQDLTVRLTALGFEVKIRQDLELAQLETALTELSAMNHADADCLLVAVLTVRQRGRLSAKDKTYDQQDLFKNFTGDKCSTLAGKPKIFLIDACEGEPLPSLDARTSPSDVPDSVQVSYMIPVEADILTVTWFYRNRDAIQGSWFLRALCAELGTRAESRDLLTLLTFVNRRITRMFSADAVNTGDEVPTFTSMLTRQLYFRKKRVQRGTRS